MQGVVSPAKPSDGGRSNDSLVIEMARLGLKMFGMAGVASGTVKPYGTVNILVQAGHISNTIAGNGQYVISFPQPFPTACIGVTCGGIISGGYALGIAGWTKTGFTFQAATGGSARAFTSSWIALGY